MPWLPIRKRIGSRQGKGTFLCKLKVILIFVIKEILQFNRIIVNQKQTVKRCKGPDPSDLSPSAQSFITVLPELQVSLLSQDWL